MQAAHAYQLRGRRPRPGVTSAGRRCRSCGSGRRYGWSCRAQRWTSASSRSSSQTPATATCRRRRQRAQRSSSTRPCPLASQPCCPSRAASTPCRSTSSRCRACMHVPFHSFELSNPPGRSMYADGVCRNAARVCALASAWRWVDCGYRGHAIAAAEQLMHPAVASGVRRVAVQRGWDRRSSLLAVSIAAAPCSRGTRPVRSILFRWSLGSAPGKLLHLRGVSPACMQHGPRSEPVS